MFINNFKLVENEDSKSDSHSDKLVRFKSLEKIENGNSE